MDTRPLSRASGTLATGRAATRGARANGVASLSPARGLDVLRGLVERRLAGLVPGEEDAPRRLHGAMRYALLAPAKRVRPLLAMQSATQFGAEPEAALDAGCAIEMVHTASLILDDLPSMDDAGIRRGRPATHLAFGEETAILAAVALLNRAFGVVCGMRDLDRGVRLDLVDLISEAVGSNGLVGGQESDLHERSDYAEAALIDALNHRKTGVLFIASVEAGARIAGLSGDRLQNVRAFGAGLGLAFQTMDDLIDSGSPEAAGKDTGRDGDKPTLVTLVGPDGARRAAQRHLDAAMDALKGAPSACDALERFAQGIFAGLRA